MDLGLVHKLMNIILGNKLSEYARTRNFRASGEPAPRLDPSVNGRVVIHEHSAKWSGKHFDWRIGHDGVLISFMTRRIPEPGESVVALYGGIYPSTYLTFEGSIPDGEYGAGDVKIYDLGTLENSSRDDLEVTGMLSGKLVSGNITIRKTDNGNYKLTRG